jgi:hypothetical protein
MLRLLKITGLLLVWVAAGWAFAQKSGASPHPAAGRPAMPRSGALKDGNPRAPRQPIGPPISNPASPAARLYRATPEERDRALEKLPPKLQERLRAQLGHFDSLPKPQQEVMIRRAERYAALTPEQREAIRQQMTALRDLPQDRRTAVGLALRRLQPLSEEQRLKTVNSDEFKSRFSTEEQQIIADLSEVMIPPM